MIIRETAANEKAVAKILSVIWATKNLLLDQGQLEEEYLAAAVSTAIRETLLTVPIIKKTKTTARAETGGKRDGVANRQNLDK